MYYGLARGPACSLYQINQKTSECHIQFMHTSTQSVAVTSVCVYSLSDDVEVLMNVPQCMIPTCVTHFQAIRVVMLI